MVMILKKRKKKAPVKIDPAAALHCDRCGGMKLPRWNPNVCADPFCLGKYVLEGEAEGNKVSIIPIPEGGFWAGARRRMFARANS